MPSSDPGAGRHCDTAAIGRSFEMLAGQFFRQQGFEVLCQNYRVGRLEIDLIVRRENLIVFVEVKSASSMKYGHPAERVDQRKVANLTHAAQQFLRQEDCADCDFRFDVVTFVKGQLEYFPAAFEALE